MNKNVWEIADGIEAFLRDNGVDVRTIKIDIVKNYTENTRKIGVGIFYNRVPHVSDFVYTEQEIDPHHNLNIEAFGCATYARILAKSSPELNITIE